MDLDNMRSLGVTRVDVYCRCGHNASCAAWGSWGVKNFTGITGLRGLFIIKQ
jgi:hypothetical protein